MGIGERGKAEGSIRQYADPAYEGTTALARTTGEHYPRAAEQAFGDYGNIQGQLQNFATTGGYSPEDVANIRSRSVSPIRSIYSGARRGIDRQRSLQGGYSPNRTAALSKMAREQSYTTADASTNVEAALAQMINQGKRFGLSGMSSLYGTTPGLANMFGQQALGAQGLQNQMGLGIPQLQMGASQLPGPWETIMGRIGQIGGAIFPWEDKIPGLN